MNYLATIFILLAAIFPQNIAAENWVEVTKSEDLLDTFYVDTDSLRKADGLVYFWDMADLTTPTPEGIYSELALRKVDCRLRRFEYVSYRVYTGNMASGEVSGFDDFIDQEDVKWEYASPGTIDEALLDFVCTYNN